VLPDQDSSNSNSIDTLTKRNIRAICELEQRALKRRSFAARLSDAIVNHAGQMWTIALHALWFVVWMLWNSGDIPGLRPFDPFPYQALTSIVSLEAIFLSLFILISQNHATRRADERDHLDLQVNLLAEHESTKMLQLLRALCANSGLPEADDPEVTELIQETRPATLARELEQELPSTENSSKQSSPP